MVLKGEEFDEGALSPYFPIRCGLAGRRLLSEFRRVFKRTALALPKDYFFYSTRFFFISLLTLKAPVIWKYVIA